MRWSLLSTATFASESFVSSPAAQHEFIVSFVLIRRSEPTSVGHTETQTMLSREVVFCPDEKGRRPGATQKTRYNLKFTVKGLELLLKKE